MKTISKIVASALISAVTAFTASCSSYEAKEVDGFSGEVQKIIQDNCVTCHSGGAAEGGFGVIANAALLTKNGYIVPGNAPASLIFQKISASPPYGQRMPYGGPYFTTSQIDAMGAWINSLPVDGEPDTEGGTPAIPATTLIVSESHGSHLSVIFAGDVSVTEGASANFTVTADSGYTADKTVGGSCAKGSWSDNVYTTGAVTENCSVSFSVVGQVTLSLTTNNVAASPATAQVVDAGSTVSFTVSGASVKAATNANAGANPTYSRSTTVAGTCPTGSWSGGVYTTGVITGNCNITFIAQNPCNSVVSGVTFATIAGILSNSPANAANVGCMSCHSGAQSTRAKYGTAGAPTTPDYATIMAATLLNSTNAAIGGKIVVAGDPLNSWLYRKVSPSWLGGTTASGSGNGRMPKATVFSALSQTEQDQICNWIFDGASN